MYKKITQSERLEIAILLQKGYSKRDIGKVMSRHHTTISREIKANSVNGNYHAEKAHLKSRQRKKYSKYLGMKVERRPELRKYIIDKLKNNWTPEQISGRIRKAAKHIPYISSKGIYKWLYSIYGQRYCCFLASKQYQPKKKRNKNKKGQIPNRVGIEKRPKEANNRTELGHMEEDTMLSGTRHNSKTTLAVFCDRRSKYVRVRKMPNLSPKIHIKTEEAMLKGLKIKTITKDNGRENRYHEQLAEKLKIKIYFCNPYHAWEKGTVENTIGRIRRFIPKGADLSRYSNTEIAKIENWLNHTPRKCLNFKTPYEIMIEEGTLCIIPINPSGAIEG